MSSLNSSVKDATAVILLKDDLQKVLWAKRNSQLRFLGGFHSFIGGKVDQHDANVLVRNCDNNKKASQITCGVREVFEEIGVLLVGNGDRLTRGQRVSLHDDLISGRSTFAEILQNWNLWIDADDFFYAGTWTTPEFSPVRFRTDFYIAICPTKQTPYSATSEMIDVEFIKPKQALDLWQKSKVLMVPPVLVSLRQLNADYHSSNKKKSTPETLKYLAESLRLKTQSLESNLNYVELNSHIISMPLRTKTLPPATHTNCFIVGAEKFLVIDAATPFESEQRKLFDLVDKFIDKGYCCAEIVVSHLHPDHFGGETALKKHILEKYGLDIPISAHRKTAESLEGKVKIDKYIDDNHTYNLQDYDGQLFDLRVLFAPGHARGHLCFYDEGLGFLLSSDNVVGQGTVVIAPPEGDMIEYLKSLQRMKNLSGLNFLCGSHGEAVFDARGRIEEYINHRLKREKDILHMVRLGIKEIDKIVEQIYVGLNPTLVPLAKKSVEAHLEKLLSENRI